MPLKLHSPRCTYFGAFGAGKWHGSVSLYECFAAKVDWKCHKCKDEELIRLFCISTNSQSSSTSSRRRWACSLVKPAQIFSTECRRNSSPSPGAPRLTLPGKIMNAFIIVFQCVRAHLHSSRRQSAYKSSEDRVFKTRIFIAADWFQIWHAWKWEKMDDYSRDCARWSIAQICLT